MPLSTSSSNDRLPVGQWMATWATTIAIVIGVVTGWEGFVRSKGLGLGPIKDSNELWARAREQASILGDKAVILVGGSRILLGINLDVLTEFSGLSAVQLAINGSPFMPVLEHLANDNTVRGTVIISATAYSINTDLKANQALKWISFYDQRRSQKRSVFYHAFENSILRKIESWLAFRKSGADPITLFSRLSAGETLHGDYITVYRNRAHMADYTKIAANEVLKSRVEKRLRAGAPRFVEIPDFDRHLQTLETNVSLIEKRGGRVVIVRFPVSNQLWDIDNIRYPRQVYWRRLVAHTSAQTIHFKDYPQLARYPVPDGSHLDYRDAVPFTRALAELIFSKK